MLARSLVVWVVFALIDVSWAIEQGDLVVAKNDVALMVEGAQADQIGPGQVLRVLRTGDDQLWVSRGIPGWVRRDDVIELDQAEDYFQQRFQGVQARGQGVQARGQGVQAHGQSKPDSRDYLARGTIRIAVGNIDAGLADLQRAIELAADPGDYLEPLGYAQLAANDQPAAIKTFNRALADEPDSTAALMGRGLAFYQVGQHRNAIKDLTQAIQQQPNHGFPRKYLGALYHDLGEIEKAQVQLDKAVSIDAYDVFTRKARGRLLFDQGDYQASLREFGIALKIDPDDTEALVGRGVLRHAIGLNLQEAANDFSSAIELSEETVEDAYLWSNLGQVQMELGHSELALANLNKAIELDSRFNEARSHRAYLLATKTDPDAKQIEQAKGDVQMVFGSNEQKTFWDYRALAAVNAALGNYQRAVKYVATGEAILRQTGPRRFITPARAAKQRYESALRR